MDTNKLSEFHPRTSPNAYRISSDWDGREEEWNSMNSLYMYFVGICIYSGQKIVLNGRGFVTVPEEVGGGNKDKITVYLL